MKHLLLISCMIGLSGPVWAAHPSTQTGATHPSTSVSAVYPQTTAGAIYPQTTVAVTHPTTGGVIRPQTRVEVLHPQTQAGVVYPQTTVEVIHPQTTVAVLHPQTPGFGGEEKTGGPAASSGGASSGGASAGKATSAQATTSMSDFTPKKAKDFKQEDPKAPQFGGGSMSLGNDTGDEAAKDAIAFEQLRKDQRGAVENFDPKNNPSATLSGLEKLVTDRAKVNQKK